MKMFKESIRELIANRDQDWITALKKAEKEGGGVDLSPLIGTQAQNWKKLDEVFSEFEIRMKSKKRFF